MATSGDGRASGPGNPSSKPASLPAVDQDAERAVLGALLLYGEARTVKNQVRKGLVESSFYWDFHGEVFAAMCALADRGDGIDTITVYAEMERLGTVSDKTKSGIDELTGYVPVSQNLGVYTNRVLEMQEWRHRQVVVHKLQDAVLQRSEDDWIDHTKAFVPDENNVVVMRRTVVDPEGQVLKDEEIPCPGCEELKDEVKGLNRDLTTWRVRYANLERNKEAEARGDGMWQMGQRLFLLWKQLTGHMRSDFTADRFYDCAPYLRNKKYGPPMVARGIVGIAFDPFVTTRRNGSKKRHDGWDLLFRKTDKFEEYVNCAPSDWESRIPAGMKPYLLGVMPATNGNGKPQEQQQLSVVEE